MKSIDALVKKALEYKEKGLSDKEIGDELHLSPETVTWLLTRGMRGEAPPKDVKIGWRSIGVYGNRIGFMAAGLTGLILQGPGKSGPAVGRSRQTMRPPRARRSCSSTMSGARATR